MTRFNSRAKQSKSNEEHECLPSLATLGVTEPVLVKGPDCEGSKEIGTRLETQPPPRIPDFDSEACGNPGIWNDLAHVYYWNRKTVKLCPDYLNPRADPLSALDFLKRRPGPDGKPIADRLGPPEDRGDRWFRCEWIGPGGGEVAKLEEAGWVRAWHGCKMESLYSILHLGRLVDSRDRERGDRFFEGAAGVYLHKDRTRQKAEHYTRYSPLFLDGTFIAPVFEVRADRSDRVPVMQRTDQWVNHARSVRLVALWLSCRTKTDMLPGDEVSRVWNSKHEANPTCAEWQVCAEHRPPLTLADFMPSKSTIAVQKSEATNVESRIVDDDTQEVCQKCTDPDALAEQGEHPTSTAVPPSASPFLEWRKIADDDFYFFCLLCQKWASEDHLSSKRHLYKIKSITSIETRPCEVNADFLERREYEPGYSENFCVLCDKWATGNHLTGAGHMRNVALAEDSAKKGRSMAAQCAGQPHTSVLSPRNACASVEGSPTGTRAAENHTKTIWHKRVETRRVARPDTTKDPSSSLCAVASAQKKCSNEAGRKFDSGETRVPPWNMDRHPKTVSHKNVDPTKRWRPKMSTELTAAQSHTIVLSPHSARAGVEGSQTRTRATENHTSIWISRMEKRMKPRAKTRFTQGHVQSAPADSSVIGKKRTTSEDMGTECAVSENCMKTNSPTYTVESMSTRSSASSALNSLTGAGDETEMSNPEEQFLERHENEQRLAALRYFQLPSVGTWLSALMPQRGSAVVS